MATVAGLRTDVFEYLYGNYPTDRPFETVLAEALDNAETEVDVLDGTDWSEGAILQHGTTGEQMLVLSVATNTLTVKRSYSTVAATAGSAGTDDLVQKNPRWTIEQVDNAVQSAIDSLELWGVHTFNTGSITLVASQYFYAVDGSTWMEPYNVLAVYYPRTDTENPVYLPFSTDAQLSTTPTEWAQSSGIFLKSKGDRASTGTLYYTFAQKYAAATDLTTRLDELVVFGALAKLFGMSIAPSTHDPGARTDRTVQPGQTSRDGRWFQGEFYIRARAESALLAVQRSRFSQTSQTARSSRWRS